MVERNRKYLTASDYMPLVADRAGVTRLVAQQVLNAWRHVLTLELSNGHAVHWFGIGRFYPHVEYNVGDWGVGAADNRRYKIAAARLKTSRSLRRALLPLADQNITAGMMKFGRVVTPGAVKGRLHNRINHAAHQLERLKRVVGDDERGAELEARLAGVVRASKKLAKKKGVG